MSMGHLSKLVCNSHPLVEFIIRKEVACIVITFSLLKATERLIKCIPSTKQHLTDIESISH